MKYRMCKVEHNPPHSYGDCIRACIATMIDRDDVPHTYKGDSAIAWSDLREYLSHQGKTLSLFTLEHPFCAMAENNPGTTYMLMGRTKNADHAVVCRNDRIIHDPNNVPTELIGETSLGCWIVGIIGEF